jgi:putative peptidoglycan lipid II flippase
MANARRVGLAALLLGGSQLLSRALGIVREMVLAAEIGAGAATDAYQAAFQIPDILNHILAVGAISIAFIPLYRQAVEREGPEAGHRLLAIVLGTLTALSVVAAAVLFAFAEPLVALQFPHFGPEQHALTVRLTRIVIPAQIFFTAGGILRAALMAEGRFGAQAAAPLVYNLGIIIGGLVGAETLGVEGFAWGALFGAAAGPFGVAFYDARRRFPIAFRFAPLDPGFRRYLVLVLPLLAGVTLLTVDEWYDRWFGGLLETGTIATLVFARRLMQAPVGLVGQAVGTAALPALADLHEKGRHQELGELVLRTLQASLTIAVAIAAALAALGAPTVRLLYERGAFTTEDSQAVSSALAIFCLAIPGWVVQSIAVRPFYARGDTWRPMLLGTVIALAMIPLYAGLGPRFGANGLAGAGAVAITVNALATLLLARRLHRQPPLVPLGTTLLRALVIALPAAAAARAVAAQLDGPGTVGALGAVAAGGLVFAVCVLPLALAFGDAPTRELLRGVGARLRRL